MSNDNLDMNLSGARELTDQELRQIQGGNWLTDAVSTVGHAIGSAAGAVYNVLKGVDWIKILRPQPPHPPGRPPLPDPPPFRVPGL